MAVIRYSCVQESVRIALCLKVKVKLWRRKIILSQGTELIIKAEGQQVWLEGLIKNGPRIQILQKHSLSSTFGQNSIRDLLNLRL